MKAARVILLVIGFLVISSLCTYAKGGINSGKPVPYLANDEASAEFLAGWMEKDYSGDEEDFLIYARSVAKTLSQFSAADQNYF